MTFKNKETKKKYHREYYHKNIDKDKKVELQRKRRTKISNEIKQIKLDKWCIICWYNKCSTSLHFDHIDRNNKELEVSEMIRRWYWMDRIIKEINKCQILCANCHWEKTHNELWY